MHTSYHHEAPIRGADRCDSEGRIGQWEAERGDYEDRILTARGPELEAGRSEGRRMTLEEAVAYALANQT
jgi:hypothetical protein